MAQRSQLIYGRHPVLEALDAGHSIDKVYLQRGSRGEFEKELRKRCQQRHIPLQYVPKEKLDRFTKSNHQGVVAMLALVPYYRLSDVVQNLFEQGRQPLLLVLDGVTDVRNFGAIARSAEVFGAQALVVPRSGSALINADAVKASAGALLRLHICREHSLVQAIDYLQQSGIQVFASDLQAESLIFELDLRGPVAFVVGAEDTGVQPALLEAADRRFRIPQQGQTDSLNVSVAAGVMLYEASRQRLLAP
ncbi:MAG: 23S rRNA (guanosine(2251)-2'-O)-methyltransferase RlmB [Saprospiraceae bacterium]|nr:MAG: 23S rRNA (guanosine(2251)-2'-O)-methyltransferase RlmB [Saprospiraceae bacterium]